MCLTYWFTTFESLINFCLFTPFLSDLKLSRWPALQSTVVEEEEDGVIYTVVVRQQHGAPNSPVVSHLQRTRLCRSGPRSGSNSPSCFLSPSSRRCLAPSAWRQGQKRSWSCTCSTPFPWATRPSSPSSSPPTGPSPLPRECWISSQTGGRGSSLVAWRQKCCQSDGLFIKKKKC